MKRISLALALSAGAVLSATVAAPSQAASQADYCYPGYSCYYDGANGTHKIWTAPSRGCHNLGDIGLNDRIDSIVNKGGGTVHLYNWNGSNAWIALGDVPVSHANFQPANLGSSANKVDMVCID
ncbi:peptidase inhibitor family I36 protein [Streptomyces sp. NPDC046977]|uniref:peptidase inhibitor family I36 protein n=1 Tax=Streptomyces sp. NPDC046977 TaxID=3154703 RepID=UPI0033E60130